MPNNTLDPALAEAYATARSNVSHIHTLELRHPGLEEPLYLVQGFRNLECTIEDDAVAAFRATAFSFTLPKTDTTGLQELTLTMDNPDNMVADFCEIAMQFIEPVEIYYRPYLSTDLTTCLMTPPMRLFLTNVKIGMTQVSGRAVPVDFLNLQFPNEDYTRETFPGLGN